MLMTVPFAITDANIVSCNVPEDDALPWNSSTVYGLNDLVIVSSTDVHQVWRSVHGVTGTWPAGNVGFNPLSETDLDNPVHWSLVGATNKYKMFDAYASTQTVFSGDISVVLTNLGVVNTLALINTECASVRVVVQDVVDGVVYDQTISMVSTSSVGNYWDYYFGQVYLRGFALFEHIPPYLNATITITTTASNGVSKVGWIVGGYGYYFGSGVKYNSQIDSRDYSIKEQLPTGEYYFAEGAYANTGEFEFDFPNEQFDLLQNLIKRFRARPTLYVAYSAYEYTLFYGKYNASPVVLSYTNHSTCRMKIESLI